MVTVVQTEHMQERDESTGCISAPHPSFLKICRYPWKNVRNEVVGFVFRKNLSIIE